VINRLAASSAYVKCIVNCCRLLIIAGDCETICDVLLDIIPMLEEVSTAVVLCVYLVVQSYCPTTV